MRLDANNNDSIRDFENWVKDELYGTRTGQPTKEQPMSDTLQEREDQMDNDDGSKDWCDDCHGYTHMPWCSAYKEQKVTFCICGIPSSTGLCEHLTSEHPPAARGGGEEWEYRETRCGVEAKAGNFVIRLHWTGLADIGDTRGIIQQIVTEHNQHQSLVAERERLERMLAAVINAHYGLAYRSIGSGDGIPEKEAAEIGRWWLDYTASDARDVNTPDDQKRGAR